MDGAMNPWRTAFPPYVRTNESDVASVYDESLDAENGSNDGDDEDDVNPKGDGVYSKAGSSDSMSSLGTGTENPADDKDQSPGHPCPLAHQCNCSKRFVSADLCVCPVENGQNRARTYNHQHRAHQHSEIKDVAIESVRADSNSDNIESDQYSEFEYDASRNTRARKAAKLRASVKRKFKEHAEFSYNPTHHVGSRYVANQHETSPPSERVSRLPSSLNRIQTFVVCKHLRRDRYELRSRWSHQNQSERPGRPETEELECKCRSRMRLAGVVN